MTEQETADTPADARSCVRRLAGDTRGLRALQHAQYAVEEMDPPMDFDTDSFIYQGWEGHQPAALDMRIQAMREVSEGVRFRWYRLCRITDWGALTTLFHGNRGSRALQRREWVRAANTDKLVRDGTSKTWYKPGWHVASWETMLSYVKAFKRTEDLVICGCHVRGLRPKEHSRHDVFLADWIWVHPPREEDQIALSDVLSSR